MLSKSKYISGLQCLRLLWFKARKPSELPPITDTTRMKFDQGTQIGLLAQQLFADGITIKHDDFFGGIAATRATLTKGLPVFEAAFYDKEKNLYSRADILVPADQETWDIYEVKSAASLKNEYIEDMAFQKFVYQICGLQIQDCYIMHINNKYCREGELCCEELFKIENVNEKVEKAFEDIHWRIDEQNYTIAQNSPPEINLDTCCFNPYECPLMEKCWKDVPDQSVFELCGGHKLPAELYKQGVTYLKDIRLDLLELSEKQRNQIMVYRQDKPLVQPDKIAEWLQQLQYPLYYLDFETYDTAIPLLDGCRPYQKIPFQFSLHIQQEKDGPAKHKSFLANGHDDERLALLQELQQSLGTEGSIVVYYEQFEKSVIRELGELFPSYSDWAEQINGRVVDLLLPFQDHYFHSPQQKGSASIKKVLPTLTDLNYGQMGISNGEQASFKFTRIVLGQADTEEEKTTKDNLLEYCHLDTLAMVKLTEALYQLADDREVKTDITNRYEQLQFQLDT